MIPSEDDFSEEWDEETETGSFRTSSMLNNFYYIRDLYSKTWYVETEITIHEFGDDEWPKIGLVARAYNSQNQESMVAFFLNAARGPLDNDKWTEFGFCEIANGHWAWEGGIPNSIARHHDYTYVLPSSSAISYDDTFKLGIARLDDTFHIYVNEAYAYSYQLSTELDVLMENGLTLDSHVGFFHFNADATFSNYKVEKENITKYVPGQIKYTSFLDD